ncbi:MAG: DNA polymerase III subunit gamma/tau [Phycisphaerae bacterium]|nr:DNA polymerase III subunit gamma/tau [Phycisphaerae bacterium]MCZ2400169.1 DNA polymerase III subunit gamma/tau [Phycisphaerae bacterium]
MAYTALARKYRSRTFSEVIGQEPIATTLANAIRLGRIHHGYLFTGTRGVGKTSMARILAKALNCLKSAGPTPDPCCECEACRAIAEGQDIDVVEIDAASNTGVDNIRELRGNTAYRPARSRFKVYIIDEVHMLSTGAFNALLKTLEEPPEHVKFILATTELQKVPATIQSRCQRFVFRNIGPEDIASRLATVIADEGASAEPAVLRRIARLANGSMRDALSILDQLMAVSAQMLTAAALDEMLPPAQDEQLLGLLRGAAGGRAADVLAAADAVLNQGRGVEQLCSDLVETLRTLMLVRIGGLDAPYADVPAAARDDYAALSASFEPSHYVQMIAMLEELRRNVRFSGAGRALTDAVLVRLAHVRQWAAIEQLLAALPAGADGPDVGDEKKKARALAAPAGPEPHAPAGGSASSAPPLPAGIRPDGLAIAAPPAPGEHPATAPAKRTAAAAAVASSSSSTAPPGSRGDGPPDLEPAPEPAARRVAAGRSAAKTAAAPPARTPPTESDPFLREFLELFDGAVTNFEWREAASGPSPAQEAAG